MNLQSLPLELRELISSHALVTCLGGIRSHSTAASIYTLFTAAEIASDGDRLCLTRRAVQEWLFHRDMIGMCALDTAVASMVLLAQSLAGPEFDDALNRIICGATTCNVKERTISIRQLLATTILLGSRPQTPSDHGHSLACTALFSIPPLVRLGILGTSSAVDSVQLAPIDPTRLWLRTLHMDAGRMSLSKKDGGVLLEDLVRTCHSRWIRYCAAAPGSRKSKVATLYVWSRGSVARSEESTDIDTEDTTPVVPFGS